MKKKSVLFLLVILLCLGCTKTNAFASQQELLTSIATEKESIYNASHCVRLRIDDENDYTQMVYVYNIDTLDNQLLRAKLEVYNSEKKDTYYFEDNYFYFCSDDNQDRWCKTAGSLNDLYSIMGTNPFDLILQSNIDSYEQKAGVVFLKLTKNLKKHILSMDENYSVVYHMNDTSVVLHNITVESYTYEDSNIIDTYTIYALDSDNRKITISYEKFYDNVEVEIPII